MQRKSLLLALLALPLPIIYAEESVEKQLPIGIETLPAVVAQVNDQPAPVVAPSCDGMTQAFIDAAPSTSLMASRPNIFSVGTYFSLDAVSDPEAMYCTSLNKPLGLAITYKLDKSDKERHDWNIIKVLRKTNYIYGANVKFDTKYEGFRESMISIGLEKMLGLTKKYTGTFLIDEYKNYPLWNIVLRDVTELRSFLTYLETNLEKKSLKSFDQKPVLRLMLKDDVLLKTIELNDWMRITAQFDIVHPCDLTTVTYFDATKFAMDDLVMRAQKNDPYEPSKGVRRSIIDTIEKPFKNFKASDYMGEVIAAGTLVLVGGTLMGYFNEIGGRLCKKLHIPTAKDVGDWIFGQKGDSKEIVLLQEISAKLTFEKEQAEESDAEESDAENAEKKED